ncbi:MAG: hypothetical protein RIS48_488 [Pseudomonadota bacterium]
MRGRQLFDLLPELSGLELAVCQQRLFAGQRLPDAIELDQQRARCLDPLDALQLGAAWPCRLAGRLVMRQQSLGLGLLALQLLKLPLPALRSAKAARSCSSAASWRLTSCSSVSWCVRSAGSSGWQSCNCSCSRSSAAFSDFMRS